MTASDSFAWTRQLEQYSLDPFTISGVCRDIDELVRIVSAGWLFDSQPSHYFQTQVEPPLRLLFTSLHKLYSDRSEPIPLSLAQLSLELQELGPTIKSDVDAALQNDPATADPLEVVICYPGFKAICFHRLAHVFYKHRIPLLPRMIAERAHAQTGIDIHPGAQIGPHFFIDHGTGVVIGETAVIGRNVTLYQGVTLGAKRFQRDATGTVIKGHPRHPIIQDRVTIYAGASILGRITIGEGSIIGGNVWVTESVPPNSRITQQRYLSNLFIDGDGI